jgi:predicted nucleic acid-binding protein
MTDKIFVDSNIWVYLFSSDNSAKSKTAQAYITKTAESSRLVVSYQVVNEVCSVLKKKRYKEAEIRRVAEDITGLCEVCGCSGEIILKASALREKHLFSYWDSQIAAAALISGCGVLASEGLPDGLKIDGIVITNVLAVRPHHKITRRGQQ